MLDSMNELKAEQEFCITTKDNPYDPFTQWDLWYDWDEQIGYHTWSVLARICGDTSSMEPEEERLYNYDSMKRLMEINPLYKIIFKK